MPVNDWNVWVKLFSRSTAESIKMSDVHILYVSICVQYFSPYVSADMNKMAQAFNTTVAALEDELTQLILEGLINARIDSHSKVMHTSFTSPGFQFLRKSPPSVDMPSDSVRERRGPEEHHIWEVAPHGQRVPETSQSHDPPGSCAAQSDPRQGKTIIRHFICLLFGCERTAVGNISVFQSQMFEKFPYRDICTYRDNFTDGIPKVNPYNTDDVSTFQSPPREGSQGELAPANSQTRMSTNMWGRCRHQSLHADPADSITSPEGCLQHSTLIPPPFVFLQQTEGTKLQWLYCPDTVPAAPLHDRGGERCFVLSDLENWQCVLMNSALQLYV